MNDTLIKSLLSAAVLLSVPASGSATPSAFPGAVGQGAAAAGGRGGDVYHVTTLDDYSTKRDEPKIEGSLRHALRSATGPRTIVFDVSGVIRLRERLEINKDLVTVAGQTSPGGVSLFGYPLEVSGAHDIVVRYLRVRCSDLNARNRSGPGPTGAGDLDASSANAVHIGDGSERVIFDHVSACWGMDETLSVTRARDVTVQNCLIAEALDGSFHKKGDHGYGSLIRGELTEEDQRTGRGGYTLYANLWAHNRARNPSIGGCQQLRKGQTEAERGRTDVNVISTVVYDWGDQAIHRSNQGNVRINLIENYYITGPAKKAKYFFRGGGGPDSPTKVFQRGNRFDRDQDETHDGVACNSEELVDAWFHDLEYDDQVRSTGEPFGFVVSIPDDVLIGAETAYERVLANVGASLWRDVIDRRIVGSVSARSGAVIDTQEVFRQEDGVMPGIDDLDERRRESDFDADRDGMADAFERANGLDPSDPADRNGTQLSGRSGSTELTNLEVYLDSLTHPANPR